MGEVFKCVLDVLCGLVLVIGLIGLGKFIILVVMFDYLNNIKYYYIFIIEDLIEFVYELKKCLVNQCEVYCDIFGFSEVLCLVLWEDLDIILVGEMCDLEIICLVLIVVEIGYLVFGILYIILVVKIIDWVVDVFLVEEKVMVCLMFFELL